VAGVFGEPAGVTSYAGLKKAVQQGKIDPTWTIVFMVTGNGLKDIASALKVAGEPRPISPDPADLAKAFPKG
jgi:threonine synthase